MKVRSGGLKMAKQQDLLLCAAVSALAFLSLPGKSWPQLNSSCTVSAFNRTAPVQADGVWVLPDVPTSLGQVRVRATCVDNGTLRFGQSGLITIPANGVITVDQIDFTNPVAIPASLNLSAPSGVLSAVGQTVQLTALATYPDGSTADVTPAEKGTTYRISNPTIATVDAGGLVTAKASGVVLVSAVNEGALGVLRVQVVTSGDSDGDGLPDDWELAHGLDPNNPVDALADPDGDGLSTIDEYRLGTDPFKSDTDGDGLLDGDEVNVYHTDPLLFDTDGDQISDGLEVRTGSDPLDANSFNLAAAIESLTVKPALFTLLFNTAVGEASRRLDVIARLIDGTEIEVRSRRYGTTYQSSDLAVANFGPEDGVVFAGQDGDATVTVQIGSFSGTSLVHVESFSPTALSFLHLPGFPNGVAASGAYAYVASGGTGLHVVDVSNLTAPVLVGTVDTPGNANDVRVQGNFAYVADGASGLQVVDVSDPTQPRIVGTRDTPGNAIDLVVQGHYVYVADGPAGVQVIDVANPSLPVLVGSVDTPGLARGIDVVDDLVVVADSGGGVHVVSVADPAAPKILGSTHTRVTWSRAADVVVRGRLAWVADGADGTLGGLRVVDFTDPSTPAVVGQTSDAYGLVSVALDGGHVLAADYYFVNGVPIFDVGPPPALTAVLDFSGAPSFRDDNGNSIAVREDGVVFLAATSSIQDNGVSGDGGLYIGRYRLEGDDLGVAPEVKLTAPAEGTSARERTSLLVQAEASDDVRVASVAFLVDGVEVYRDFNRPYEATIQVPAGVSSFQIGAVASDLAGNEGTAEEITVNVIPNAKPEVALLAPAVGAQWREGGQAEIVATASDDSHVATVQIFIEGALWNTFTQPPYRALFSVPLGATQVTVEAVATDSEGQTASATTVVAVVADEPPLVAVVQPNDGAILLASSLLEMMVGATDDIGVTRVVFLVNDVPVGEADTAPYIFDMVVPANASELRFAAEATDTVGRTTRSPEVRVSIVSNDPLTTATGTVVDPQGAAAAGASVTCAAVTGTTLADGAFSIPGVPSALGSIRCRASFRDAQGRDYSGTSRRVAPVPSGVTNVGQIQLQLTDAFLYPGPQLTVEANSAKVADVNGDGIPDLIVAAPYDGVAVFLGKPNKGYEAVQYYETAGSPKDVWIGDFNGDGIPDVATANGSSYGVSVLLGNGDGTFQPHIDSAAGTGPVALAAGDFNQDGRLDLAGANGSLVVLLGNGDGTLTFTGGFIPAAGAVAVRVGDVDQDGHLDLLSAGRTFGDVRIFRGDGTGAFTLNRTVSLGGYTPADLTVEDLNGDGRLDFATASNGNKVLVFFGQADGSYLAGPALATGSRTDPVSIIASDLNADGHLDLATANNGTSDVSLFLGNGSGSFSSARTVFTGASPRSLTSGDLNRDGIADLVTADVVGVSLIYGVGNATFDTDRRYPAGEFLAGVTVGDFNGDGAQDLAVASQDSDEVSVLLGRGDGTFAPEHRFATGPKPADVVTADFNGDGRLDLATANLSGDSVSLLLGQGDGTFASPSSWPTGQWPVSLRAVDLNGDGHPDLAVANADSNDVSILLGNGDGTFAPQTRYPVGGYPSDLAVGDFNGDGRPDLATANEDSDDVSILSSNADGIYGPEVRLDLGTAQAPPPTSLAAPNLYPLPLSLVAADLDGDGKQDLAVSYLHESSPIYQDLLGVLLGNGDGTFQPLRTTPAVVNPFGLLRTADVNGDGIPDLVDASPGGAATQDLAVLLGLGDGTFGEPQRYNVGCGPYYLASGDFNGDGQTDLVASTIGCYDTYDLSILIHH
jgi:hypothetical protein